MIYFVPVCERCGEPASQSITWDEDKGVTRIHYYCKKHFLVYRPWINNTLKFKYHRLVLKKRKKQNITLAVIATVILVAIISYNYSADQTKIKGFNFGNELQQIQDKVKKLQNSK